MKKKVLLLAVIAICAAICASGTLAYFTAEDRAHNVITTNGIGILIEEWQETAAGLVPYPKDKPIDVMPGVAVSKIAAVKNLEADAYIRAKIDLTVMDPEGNVMDLSGETLEKIISVAVNTDHWIRKADDGQWWYYSEVVDGGDTTEALFTEVVFSGPNMTNEYQRCTVNVVVTAQAVQAANNGEAVMEAAGWPAE